MPIQWKADHASRLVTAVVHGTVNLAAFERYLAEVDRENAMPYRKLFDVRFAEMNLTSADLRRLGACVNEYARRGPLGPIAFVAAGELHDFMVESFDARANVDRPLRRFHDIVEARAWLDSV